MLTANASLTYIKVLVLAVLVALVMSAPASASTVPHCSTQAYCGDYETGNFSQWHFTQFLGGNGCGSACTLDNVGNATASIITSPVHQGMYAAKYQVFSTGGGLSTKNRSEVVASQADTGGFQGQEWYYGWWTYFPGPSQTWWAGGADFNDTFQFFDQANQQAFIIGGVDATLGHPTLYIDGPFGHTTLADPLVYDHWYHFVVRAKWSLDPAVGLWKLWLDGVVKQPLLHIRTMGQAATPSITYAQGFYSKRDTNNTVIHDGFCRAATRTAANAC